MYDDPFHPALTQTLDELSEELRTVQAYKAVLGTRLVGAVRTRRDGAVLHLSRLVAAPDLQGRGLGSALLRHVEEVADPDVGTFALFTGARSEGNLRLYRRHGYVERREEVLPGGIELVHLDKPRG